MKTENDALSEHIKTNIPEILLGHKIDWQDYAPPGGVEWQSKYRSEYRASIERDIKELNRIIKTANSAQEDIAQGHRHIENIRESIGKVESIFDCHRFDRTEQLELMKGSLREMLATIDNIKVDEASLKKARSTVSVLEGLRNLFDKDAQYDMIMWALNLVDVKYRTKVFREAVRRHTEITAIIEGIDAHIPYADKSKFEGYIAPFHDLRKAYETMTSVIKMAKKGVSTYGQKFWTDSDPNEEKRLRMHSKSFAGTWELI